ncbi:hypothetical protein EMMF5_003158 [Cystobasidiomycetes sp. EMM_F5]
MANNNYSYDDEIDLYGDVTEAASPGKSGNAGGSNNQNGAGGQADRPSDAYDNKQAISSIPTFISEARGGTGIIPMRDEFSRRNDGSGQKNDYGNDQQQQWQNRPMNNARSADGPDEGRVKMFIGGLNWETTEESMQKYFEQFGEVAACTIMKDPHSGRSRGFGFLTFADPVAVNTVMVKEHFLDGKIIDPKRAIPRPEMGTIRNDKLFVRHVPQSMDYYKFKEYFSQFGTVVDCNLMMDRETGVHRGFGFVTYEDASSSASAVNQQHEYDGQFLEVKLATQKRDRDSTYVGDRPNFGRRNYDQGGRGGGNFNNNGAYNNGPNDMGGMGMGNMSNMGGGMGGMGGMGMGGQGGQGAFDPYAMAQFFKQMGWGNFNPMMAMPGMMGNGGMGMGMGMGGMGGMMDPSMMGMMGGMNGMGGMNPMAGMSGMGGMGNMGSMNNMAGMATMGNMAGAQSPQSGFGGGSDVKIPSGPKAQSSASSSTARQASPADAKPPSNAPTGPAAMRGGGSGGGAGPVRNNRGGNRDHPYR